MAKQRCINWFISYLFKLFAPRVTFTLRFPDAIAPTPREEDTLRYLLYTPFEVNPVNVPQWIPALFLIDPLT